jgi:hypothetical protein
MKPILLFLLLLTACSDPAAVAQNACPPIKPYSTAEQQKAAEELLKLPPGSMLGQMIVDYGSERARLRACRTTPPGS